MKLKKIIPLLFTTLALSSCGTKSYAGRYSFQMGKDDGAHFGVAVTLTDEDHYYEEKLTGKSFNITASSSAFGTEDGKISIDGGYTIGDPIDKEGNYLVNLSFDEYNNLIDFIISFITGGGGFEEIDSEKTSDYLQKLLTTQVDDKAFYFTIPVSINDLYLQTYWYGLDICNNSGVKEVTEHPLHSHPTQEEIDNLNANDDFYNNHKDSDGIPFAFRDYHTIMIGLTRDDKK